MMFHVKHHRFNRQLVVEFVTVPQLAISEKLVSASVVEHSNHTLKRNHGRGNNWRHSPISTSSDSPTPNIESPAYREIAVPMMRLIHCRSRHVVMRVIIRWFISEGLRFVFEHSFMPGTRVSTIVSCIQYMTYRHNREKHTTSTPPTAPRNRGNGVTAIGILANRTNTSAV